MDIHSQTLKSNGEQVLLGKRTNVLLVKDDVGKAKPSTRALPGDTFTFGRPENRDAETAADGKYFSCCPVPLAFNEVVSPWALSCSGQSWTKKDMFFAADLCVIRKLYR